jgi:Tfp pilus assembly protein PilF
MKAFLSIVILACTVGCSAPKQTATRSTEQSSAIPSLKTAEQLYHDGQLDSAELALRAILKADPKNQEAKYYLSLVYRSEAEVASRQPKPQGYYQTIPQQPIY